MDALTKLQDLYTQRENITKQIDQIAELLGTTTEEKPKQKRTRGPNKKKEEKETKQPPANVLS